MKAPIAFMAAWGFHRMIHVSLLESETCIERISAQNSRLSVA